VKLEDNRSNSML